MIEPESLYGTWRLVGSSAVDSNGQSIGDPWGPAPMGTLVLDRMGRMMAQLVDGRLELPEGVERAYSSYSGRYIVEGDLLTTTIYAASDPSRIGSKQPRVLSLRDELLVLAPPPRADGERREIVWQRIGS
jgi:Lipocalin-like domain